MINFLLPIQVVDQSLDELLENLSTAKGEEPFNNTVLSFVGRLSRLVLTEPVFRSYPELMAMAHWFRPASLLDLRKNFHAGVSANLKVRRGVVFHLAPSNVDSVFIYSWLLSLLCGNANIARVSRRRTPQMQEFFKVVASLLQEPEFHSLYRANLVISYEHDALLTAKLSAKCHMRVIWGGDDTIKNIRAISLPPLATEMAFANRFSLAVINAKMVAELNDDALGLIVRGFYNDVFWFNQQACSSPRAVVWIGDNYSCALARSRFWIALNEQISIKKPENLPAQVANRVTTLFRIAELHADSLNETTVGALPTRLCVHTLFAEDRNCHDGNGLILELQRCELLEIAEILSSRDQTIAYFGFNATNWSDVVPFFPPHAADRIVPIGEALNFSPVWDGVNLLHAFTREVQLR